MSKNKKIDRKETGSKEGTIFCTECGEELELFSVNESRIDLKKLKQRYQRCKDTGKFKGDKCAMLFIADSSETALFPDEDE